MKGLSKSLLALALLPLLAHSEEKNWADEQRDAVKSTLHDWSNDINEWFGETDPSRPASASLRVMLDNEWNRYDGYSIKPRIRGKIRLPIFKKHFNAVFGDDGLDDELLEKNRLGRNYQELERGRRYNSREARESNGSLALRWSEGIKNLGVDTDFDVGVRGIREIFGRINLGKTWQYSEKVRFRLEQTYRYGSRSHHFARTNFEQRYTEDDRTYIANTTYLQYTFDSDRNEDLYWANSTYRQHNLPNLKQLNYGISIGGRVKHGSPKLNRYGPFVSWRQPIYRQWLFIQPELNYYNDREAARRHHIGAFLRLEALY